MEVFLAQQLVQVHKRSSLDSDLWVGNVGSSEVNNEQPMLNFSNVQAIVVRLLRLDKMGIPKEGIFLIPARTTHEIVAIDNIKLIHLIPTISVKT